MNTIMINIYAENIDSVLLRNKLDGICSSVYKIANYTYLVRYSSNAKDLYDNIYDVIQDGNVFVCEISTIPEKYWGFMDKSLWEWLREA